MDFSNVMFRCSSLGHLMTEPKTKSDKEAGNLSETAKTHLLDIYISEVYGRKTDIENKYIKKGLAVEEDAITLYSRVSKVFYKKNETHLHNTFIKGTPDLYEGKSIHEADVIPDIKSSWNIYTFFRTFGKSINQLYYWQLQGYMWLTGASNAKLVYCLVNTPEPLIEAEIRSLWYKLGQPAMDGELFIEAANELTKSMQYDDIPLNDKILCYEIKRDDSDIDKIKAAVIKGREYLSELHKQLNNR